MALEYFYSFIGPRQFGPPSSFCCCPRANRKAQKAHSGCGRLTLISIEHKTIGRDLRISTAPLTAEIADTPQASENGLMFRDSLPEDRGMLFVFEPPKKATFWMRNTKVPLSIAFIDSAGTILEIKPMYPMDESIVPSRSDQVAYALEVNQGWFERHRISAGAKIDGIPRK